MRIVDLTMPLSNDTVIWPGFPRLKVAPWKTFDRDKCRVLKIDDFTTHSGTHVDAPAHLLSDGKELADISWERMMGTGVVLNIPKGELELIGPHDLEKAQPPRVRKNDIVLIHTGWGAKWHTADLDYLYGRRPGLSIEGAEWLANKDIKAIGMDTFAPQVGGLREAGMKKSVHSVFMEKDIIIVEQLMNLDKIAGERCRIEIVPLSIKGAEGAPARVLAFVKHLRGKNV